jgi:membrane protein YqaA with SNARE-associated domain
METSIIVRRRGEEDSREYLTANKVSPRLMKPALTVLLVMGTLAICVAVIYYRNYFEQFRYLGYPGAFIFGFIAGSSLPLPLPYLIVTFSLGGVLNPVLVGMASGAGAGIGGTLVYLFGSSSRRLLQQINIPEAHPAAEESTKAQKLHARLEQWTHRRGSLVVFIMSVLFNPLFAPMAVAIGALRFGCWRFLFWCTLGNVIKSIFIAYCGYYGLNAVLRWSGV